MLAGGVTTHTNPGAFQARHARGLRAIASAARNSVRNGNYRAAALGVVVDAANLFEARAGTALRPQFRCSCCGHEAHGFRHLIARERIAWHSACPRCDSRSRHRGLAVLLPQLIDEHRPSCVLHFAPEPVLRSCFDRPGLAYETADLFLEDVTHPRVDLRSLPFSDGAYDLVVCNHVLEHLPTDGEALSEIRRVLSPRGLAVITVPGDFARRETQYFEGELENGHYRDYGLDFTDRLQQVFPNVRVVDLHDLDRDTGGLSRAIRRRDLAFVCERGPNAG